VPLGRGGSRLRADGGEGVNSHVDLFSGIGGFSLGLERAGFKTIVFCEQDKFCQKVLNKHWPEIPIEPDIKTFDGKKYAGAFILTGGFPCQPFSCAGKRRGKEDERALWPEMFRVIQEVRPTWIIGENVAGFIGMGLDDSISDLEREGYSVQAFIIPACAVNAPHRRDRVWIVAHRLSRPTKIRHAGTVECENGKEGDGRKTKIQNTASYRNCHAPDTSNQGLQRGEETGNTSINGDESRNELIGRCLGWQEPWLEAATRLCRVDARVSNRVDRLKSLGNAVVPQIPEIIGRAIMEIEQ
jgi:DNA (cytosine-5)-methyltransferase 1